MPNGTAERHGLPYRITVLVSLTNDQCILKPIKQTTTISPLNQYVTNILWEYLIEEEFRNEQFRPTETIGVLSSAHRRMVCVAAIHP